MSLILDNNMTILDRGVLRVRLLKGVAMSKMDLSNSKDNLLGRLNSACPSSERSGDRRLASDMTEKESSPFKPVDIAGRENRRQLLSAAREIQKMRECRNEHLPSEMFGEAAWDIMLALYVEEERHTLSLTAISMATRVPMTTLLRWVTYLELKLLVATVSVSTDARVRLLTLTHNGREIMDQYMMDILRMAPAPSRIA
jgi:DNA-binding MarR family transcriptional regulator